MVYRINHAFHSRLDVFLIVLYYYSILQRIQELTNSVSWGTVFFFLSPNKKMLGTLKLDLPIPAATWMVRMMRRKWLNSPLNVLILAQLHGRFIIIWTEKQWDSKIRPTRLNSGYCIFPLVIAAFCSLMLNVIWLKARTSKRFGGWHQRSTDPNVISWIDTIWGFPTAHFDPNVQCWYELLLENC